MGSSVKSLYLLIMILHISLRGLGDKSYKVINFKVPQVLLRQALEPTPVLKSPVTITLPINFEGVEDNDIDEDLEDDEVETTEEDSVATGNVTEVLHDDVPVVSSTQAPVQDLVVQNEEITPPQDQEVPGQVVRYPCACRERNCGCCTGTILERIRMKACGNITFIPEDFVFDVRMSVNNNTVVRRRVSASDPPPICFNPRRAPFVRVCVEISNIRIRNRNAHACLDINADIAGFPIYSASFRCFSFGSSGLQTGLKPKPVSSGPKPVNLFGSSSNNNGGGFIQDAASSVFGGQGLFGGGSSSGGPFDAIGDALGDFLDGA